MKCGCCNNEATDFYIRGEYSWSFCHIDSEIYGPHGDSHSGLKTRVTEEELTLFLIEQALE